MKIMTALMAVAALGLAACGSSGNKSSSASTSSGSSTTASSSGGAYGSSSGSKTTVASSSSTGSKSVAVSMQDNFFGPKVITGKAGSTVTVNLKNTGQAEHHFQ